MRKKQRNRLLLVFCLLILVGIYLGFKMTETGTYRLMDYSAGTPVIKGTYHHYWIAKNALDSSNDSSLCIVDEQNNILAMKQGIVDLRTKDVTQNTSYTMDGTDETGYTNGQYGADALYLGTNHDGSQVLCMISGVRAWINRNEVQLIPTFQNVHPSYYTVSNDSLYHSISVNVTNDQAAQYRIGPKPESLKENKTYYSYDGHWFYDNLETLSNDMQLQQHKHAINKEAYYNPYQYMPHRSKTSLNTNDYNTFLASMNKTNSLLYNQGNTFLESQSQYGINATMVFALACNESAFGQSAIALATNNLFGHAAYDSNPNAANSYSSVADCIKAHDVEFIQKGYANPNDSRYHGSWFGDKASGINVSYASDPYWGEKAASYYYLLESNLKQNIKTWVANQDISVYDKPNGNVLYTYKKGSIVSVLVKKKHVGWLEIASETPIQKGAIDVNQTYHNDRAYIKGE